MEILLFTIIMVVAVSFGAVILRGAPFLPTKKMQVEAAFKLLNLKKGQTLVDLGSGSGTLLRAAAKRGIKAEGIEMNPILYTYSVITLHRYKDLVKLHYGDIWKWDLPKCDAVFIFGITSFMPKFKKKLQNEAKKKIKVVSFAFKLPGQKIKKEASGVYLYEFNKTSKM